jgi:formylglycine-generating enzyme required for sulfatase activity
MGNKKATREGMGEEQTIDITEMMVIANQFPVRLHQLGYRVIQKMDEQGQDLAHYVIPPMVRIPAGPFLMGSDKEKDEETDDDECPQHEVHLETYEIGKYPLTVAEYQCFLKSTERNAPYSWEDQMTHQDHPVVEVSWDDTLAYVQWVSQMTGEGWRLPTEAEWEKAATPGEIRGIKPGPIRMMEVQEKRHQWRAIRRAQAPMDV